MSVETLLQNKEYSNAFTNYFFLLGCGKKGAAQTWKKKMEAIENNFAK